MQLLRASFPSRVASDLRIHRRAAEDQAAMDFSAKRHSKITSQMNTFDILYIYIHTHTHNSSFILLIRKKK